MKTVFTLTLFLLAATACAREKPNPIAEPQFVWREFGPGMTEAQASGKIIVVDVYTSWCKWCRKLDREVLSQPEVQAYLSQKFIPVKLNAENRNSRVQIGEQSFSFAQALAAYGVQGFPTTLFLEPGGQLLFKFSGFRPKDEYLEILKYFGERKFESEPPEK